MEEVKAVLLRGGIHADIPPAARGPRSSLQMSLQPDAEAVRTSFDFDYYSSAYYII
jgi:hypothetical protein